ncbi:MAG TPA: hypothetical protein VJP80_02990 [Candidatus Saccharimonadales bacterium]|nr:hypothetical protein [Candidatus Saccharimonadales bacterium]
MKYEGPGEQIGFSGRLHSLHEFLATLPALWPQEVVELVASFQYGPAVRELCDQAEQEWAAEIAMPPMASSDLQSAWGDIEDATRYVCAPVVTDSLQFELDQQYNELRDAEPWN